MSEAKWTAESLLRFFRLSGEFEIGKDSFWWRTDGEYAPVTVLANCSDLFWWACADVEEVTPENIGELERAWDDVRPVAGSAREIGQHVDASLAVALFCARLRGMRPQGAYYAVFPPAIAAMFDACGPERAVGAGNTRRREWDPASLGAGVQATGDPPWKCRSCRETEAGAAVLLAEVTELREAIQASDGAASERSACD